MVKETILLTDMDGVICNFVDGILDSHKSTLCHDDIHSFDMCGQLKVTPQQFWDVTNDGQWWLALKPYEWASVLVDEMKKRGTVIFCTSPSLDSQCPSQKVEWLRINGFMKSYENTYQIGNKKELNAGSGAILIDDSDHNCDKYIQAGGYAISFPQPWNRAKFFTKDRVGYTLNYVDRIISSRQGFTN